MYTGVVNFVKSPFGISGLPDHPFQYKYFEDS